MFRIIALIALLTGFWYLRTGNCDMWWGSQPLLTTLAGLVMFCFCLGIFWDNIIQNKVFNGVLSIAGAVYTSIYWYVWVWSDRDIFACRGPKTILIGGITMFLIFIGNAVIDYFQWDLSQDETRKEIED